MALCGCTLKGDKCGLWGLGTIMECSLNGWWRLMNTMKVWTRIDLHACNWGWITPIKQVGTTQTCNQSKRSSTNLSHQKVGDWQEMEQHNWEASEQNPHAWSGPTICVPEPSNMELWKGMVSWLLFLGMEEEAQKTGIALKNQLQESFLFCPKFQHCL